MHSQPDTNLLKDTLVLILAGGRGERLYPLTSNRTKGAVPFGGMYRIIDFTLTNCLHSDLRRICILPQYRFASLERHLRWNWNFFRRELGEHLDIIPPQQRVDTDWYRGTADAVFQNIYTLNQERPKHVLILSSDHIYRMDYGKLLARHAASRRSAPRKMASCRMASSRSAFNRMVPRRSASLRLASRRSAFSKMAPLRSGSK